MRTATRRGFSLVELILSIAITGTALILVVGIFTFLIAGSQKATDLTTGSAIADGLLSQQIYQICSVDDVRNRFFRASYGTPTLFRGGTYALNNNVYYYKIYCQDAAIGANLRDADVDPTGQTQLKRFDILVWWNDSAAAAQTQASNMRMSQTARGVGLQEVHQMRIVWPTTGDSGQ